MLDRIAAWINGHSGQKSSSSAVTPALVTIAVIGLEGGDMDEDLVMLTWSLLMYYVKLSGRGPEMILVDISRSNALFKMADECSNAEAEFQIHLTKYLAPISFWIFAQVLGNIATHYRRPYTGVLQSFHIVEPFLYICVA